MACYIATKLFVGLCPPFQQCPRLVLQPLSNLPEVEDTPKDSEKCEKNDVVEYCKEMLQKSMLTGVPQIVTAPTLRSKIFKTFVVLGSFTGFLYQTSTFLMMYFSYPTLVDVQVTTPPFVDVPAVTICNRNGGVAFYKVCHALFHRLKRKEYCNIRPENCGPSAFLDVFCQRYPKAAKNGLVSGSDLFPKVSAFHEEVSATQEMIKQFGHQSYPLVYSCEFGEVNVTFDFCKNSTFKSFIFQDLYGRMKKCYILNALWSTATLNLPQVPTRAMVCRTNLVDSALGFGIEADWLHEIVKTISMATL
ncbi:uncharacterized protein CEXT_711671 [Caerostris extrusa]|uniref:Uncharacterized protein n=1 Tax=Caerostris extrusa TaxID=172846 RepID=A0AAV4W946_CAEEX|nr:uncharacterized protein CEXT_711671 [Caerostris extrusa]